MNSPAFWLPVAASLLAGVLLGAFYFGGLWLTVDGLAASRRPGARLVASFALRALAALLVFALIAREAQAPGIIAALAGFLGARLWIVRRTQRGKAHVERRP